MTNSRNLSLTLQERNRMYIETEPMWAFANFVFYPVTLQHSDRHDFKCKCNYMSIHCSCSTSPAQRVRSELFGNQHLRRNARDWL